jgi:hypothetical protein
VNYASDTERRRWQRRAVQLLVDLDKRHPTLPAITWLVSEWALVGQCHGIGAREARRQFDAWVDGLGLTRWQERTSPGGATHLHAASKNFDRTGVDVAVTADLFDDIDDIEEDEI